MTKATMRDDEVSGLPVARIEPRGAADRMVIVRAAASRRAGQIGRAGVVVGKVAGFVGLLALLATLGGTSRPRRYDIEIKIPKFEYRFVQTPEYRQMLLDLATPKYQPIQLEDVEVRDPFEKPVTPKPVKQKRVKRQPRP